MHDSVDPKRPTGSSRASLLVATALFSGVLVAGCGGGSHNLNVASVARTTGSTSKAMSTGATTTPGSSTAASIGAASSGPPTQAALDSDELAFAKCMRSSGVPNFPDPSAGRGFQLAVPAGGPSLPLLKAAQAKCNKLVPDGGLARPGAGLAPSAQALAHWVTVAQCMRRHGVPNFPDPTTTAPSLPLAGGGGGVISDHDGVILVFPHTIDEQSPLFTRAADACGFRLTNH
jgi:hypothetical protein